MITVEQKGDRNLLVFDRDNNNQRLITEVTDFQPYFYTEDFLEGKHISLLGERTKKIFVDKVKDVPLERKGYSKVYEADIHYTDRYIIDRIKIPIPKRNLRKCFLDIETDDSIDTLRTPKPITSISCFDSYLKKVVTFCWRSDLVKKEEKSASSLYQYSREDEMLEKFLNFIISTDPDLLIGFNVDFDLGYIVNRCRKMWINPNIISPMKYIKIDKYGVRVYGRVVLDIRKLIKRNFIRKELYSYDLNNVAKYLINKEKIEVKKSKGTLWREDFKLLIEYNVQDVLLLKEMDEKMSIIDFYDSLRREVGCGWDRITSFSYLFDIETYRKSKEFGFIVPKSLEEETQKSVEGAFVQEPEKGLYKWIINLDVTSQYPYAIISGNISPETLSNEGDIVIEPHLKFKSDKLGIIPAIILDERKRREKAKKEMFEELRLNGKSDRYKSLYIIQYSSKVLMNSKYGLFNHDGYVLRNKALTEAITSFARQSIHWAKNIVEKEGYKVIYTDTDGLYIKSNENAIKIGKELQDKINNSYKDFLRSLGIKNGELKIKFENIYDSFFIGSKKHYFGHVCWNEDNEVNDMVVKGYEVIRVDTAKVCKEMMDTLFKMILENKSKKEVEEYVSKLKKDIVNYPIEDISIPKPYKKENKVKTAHFKAVQFSNRFLEADIKEGSRVLYFYGYIQGLPKTEAIAFEKNNIEILKDKKIFVNYKKMTEVLIDKKADRLFEVLGWKKEENENTLLSYGGDRNVQQIS